MFRKYALKKPARRHARIGAFYAGLLPVIIGFMLLFGAFGEAMGLDRALLLPIAMVFLFGTPIVAWLSQDAIMQRERLDYMSLVEVALTRATIVQLIFGTLYLVYYLKSTSDMATISYLISTCVAAQVILWFAITLPMTLACSVIFKLSALRPVYG